MVRIPGGTFADRLILGVAVLIIVVMDRLATQAAEEAVHANYPDCGGLLLVELDGPSAEVQYLIEHVSKICTDCGAWEIRIASTEADRAARHADRP